MDTRNDTEGSDSEPRLGRGSSFVVGCGIGVALLLCVGSAVGLHARNAEQKKKRDTERLLYTLRSSLAVAPPRADGSGSDWTGIGAVASLLALEKPEVLDGWGNPIRYRCPGPRHKKGFDFYSCGPNGRDDGATFDDLCEGEERLGARQHGRR